MSVHSMVSTSQTSALASSSLPISREILLGPQVKPSDFPLVPATISMYGRILMPRDLHNFWKQERHTHTYAHGP